MNRKPRLPAVVSLALILIGHRVHAHTATVIDGSKGKPLPSAYVVATWTAVTLSSMTGDHETDLVHR